MSRLRPKPRKPRWISHVEWLCTSRRHIPSKRISATTEFCYWGCGTARPPMAERPDPPPRWKVTIRETVALYPPPGQPDSILPPPVGTVVFPTREPPADEAWKPLAGMAQDELLGQRLTWLRKYATHGLGIPRASKIRGGKIALIDAILKKRAESAGSE